MKRYDPIIDALNEHERKMNLMLVSFCIVFAALSMFYVVRFLLVRFYSPEDGLYYYQYFFELGSGISLLAVAVISAVCRNRHPRFPRYLFLAVYLCKAMVSSVFFEFNYFIFYVIPVVASIGYYNITYSIVTATCTLLGYIAAEVIGALFGIVQIEYYDVPKVDGMLFLFDDSHYVSNRLLGQTFPIALMLFFVCLLAVLLAKTGADTLLRENKVDREKASVDKELSLGRDIQQSMLPPQLIQEPNYAAFGYMVSAKNVGGDFYDYFKIDDQHVLITIGDVSGKGVSASLFASNTKALIRAFAMSGFEPNQILQRTNAALCATNQMKLFVTVWIGILNLTTGDFVFSNAGHNLPMIQKANGKVKWMDWKPNFVIGRREHISYLQHHRTLLPGESIILYTDGVTESMNEKGILFGEKMLMEYATGHPVDESFISGLKNRIVEFRGNAEQNDDITIACLTFKEPKSEQNTEQCFKASREDYLKLCSFVIGFAEKFTDDRKTLNDIEISLGEIFSNIEFYSSKDEKHLTDVTVSLSYENGMLSIAFSDNGVPFDPLKRPDPSLEENRKNKVVGGFGIFMVKKLMDDVVYRYEDKNTLILKKRLKEVAEHDSECNEERE